MRRFEWSQQGQGEGLRSNVSLSNCQIVAARIFQGAEVRKEGTEYGAWSTEYGVLIRLNQNEGLKGLSL